MNTFTSFHNWIKGTGGGGEGGRERGEERKKEREKKREEHDKKKKKLQTISSHPLAGWLAETLPTYFMHQTGRVLVGGNL